jgi:hypothetical protein
VSTDSRLNRPASTCRRPLSPVSKSPSCLRTDCL